MASIIIVKTLDSVVIQSWSCEKNNHEIFFKNSYLCFCCCSDFQNEIYFCLFVVFRLYRKKTWRTCKVHFVLRYQN